MLSTRKFATFLAAALFCTSAFAQTHTFTSGTEQNLLIELYTSEGCSSCPPADRWLSSLKKDEATWSDVIPIAFHVDYWDRLGWKDRFASRDYSQRQRMYARQYSERTVYTPGVRGNGAEWRSWRRLRGASPPVQKNNVGDLSVTVAENGQLTATYQPVQANTAQQYMLNIAVLGMNAKTFVERGENEGRTLEHDFVVLAHTTHAAKAGEITRWQESLPKPNVSAPKYALAAWVSADGSLNPEQATGGYLELFPKL